MHNKIHHTPLPTISEELQRLINTGDLLADAAQAKLAARLDILLTELAEMAKPKLFKSNSIPKGIYIWGDVGRGKSMLMDMFYEKADINNKTRTHFHAFMQNVHKRINEWRKMDKKQRRKRPEYVRSAGDDPIAPVAKHIAKKARLLCFDEFHVSDIADAMILSRLFNALFDRGVVIIATSNRAPDDLYKNGLNRQLFLPFIALIKQKMDIFELGGRQDHRLRKLERAGVYFTPLGVNTDKQIEDIWQRLTKISSANMRKILVQGRDLEIMAGGNTARADFADLCEKPLGAGDYLAIARTFSTLILTNVPKMNKEMRNEAKRFVTLVDALYEAKTKLVMSAEAEPEDLYRDGDGSFEFARTVSRLVEMRSQSYLAQEHISRNI